MQGGDPSTLNELKIEKEEWRKSKNREWWGYYMTIKDIKNLDLEKCSSEFINQIRDIIATYSIYSP